MHTSSGVNTDDHAPGNTSMTTLPDFCTPVPLDKAPDALRTLHDVAGRQFL